MKIAITLAVGFMKLIYFFLKLLPTRDYSVLFLSRQSDELSLDFRLLQDALEAKLPKVRIVAITNRLDDKKKHMLRFAVNVLRSMYYLATSEVCVLDAYWPAVSLLTHKKDLTVIQMWHAVGKIKQSGYQTVGKESGRSRRISELLRMHRNYDIVIAGGSAWNPYYAASFDISEDKLVNIGLPRLDYLLHTAEENKRKVLERCPQLREKQVILYAPTFRRGADANWEDLVNYIDFERYVLIIKGHPNQAIRTDNAAVLTCPEFSAVELLSSCDYLITDYSAIAVEAAVLNRKTYYYLYDYEEYAAKNGLNVDPFESMPGCAFQSAAELMAHLDSGHYPQAVLDRYREKYLPENLGSSTERFAALIISRFSKEKADHAIYKEMYQDI